MKIRRISAGVYYFENDHGFRGEILRQPEGGWSIWDINKQRTIDYVHLYALARSLAAKLKS